MNNMIDAIVLYGGIVIGGIIFLIGVKIIMDKEKVNPEEKNLNEDTKEG